MRKWTVGKAGLLLTLAAAVLCIAQYGCARNWYYSQPQVLEAGGPWARIPAQETFMFVVIGDTRTGIDVFKEQIEEINQLDPDLVLDVGDLINGYSGSATKVEAMWDEFDEIVGGFEAPLVMIAGNHDIWDRQAEQIYQRRYGKTYFSFDHKGVHFVALNTEMLDEDGAVTSRIEDEQLQWLKDDLAKHQGARATFVFLHKPLWQEHHVPAGSSVGWMANVHPLLVKYNVSAVFAGHVHKYTYFGPIDGVHYYITGGGGAGIGTNEAAGDFHHYCVVTVRGDDWRLAVIRPGSVKDQTVVTGEHMLARQIATVAPITVSAAGEKIPLLVALRNPLQKTVEVAVWPDLSGGSRWRISPEVATAVLQPGQQQELQFNGSVDSLEQAYPGPAFATTVSGLTDKTVTARIVPLIEPLRVAQCLRAAARPELDGKLDDSIWQDAKVKGDFLRSDGSQLAQFATEVWVAYDRENLYLACRCQEPNLEGMVVNADQRDGKVWEDDSVEVFLDTNFDRKSYYQFIFNPAGVIYDGKGWNAGWNAACTVGTGREKGTWTLEAAISWASLEMAAPTAGKKIGLEIARSRQQSPSELTQWSPTFSNSNHCPEQFGTLIIGP